MSLIRLLAAGSSLRGIKDRRSPYKMTQQHLLPKFGSGKPGEPKAPVAESVGRTTSLAGSDASLPAENEQMPMSAAEANVQAVTTPEAASPAQDQKRPSRV